jgi:hypothetical protein
VITASGGTVTAISGKERREPRFWTWRRAGAIIVGLATIAGAIAAILALHRSDASAVAAARL